MNKLQLIPFLFSISASSTLLAAGAPVGTIFPENEAVNPAGANQNFQELADRIDDLDVSLTSSLESSISQLDQDLIDLSSLLDSYSGSLTTEFYQLQDELLTESARINADVSRLSGEISTNEVQDNVNYQALQNRIETAAPTVTYSANENLASRFFVDVNPEIPGECNERRDNFNFDTTEKVYAQDIVVSNSSDDIPCSDVTYYWDYANGLSSSFFVLHTSTSEVAFELSRTWQVLKGVMRMGESWGAYSTRSFTVDGSGPLGNTPVYHKMTLLGVEDVTVPAGSFSDCLVIEDQARFGETQDTQLYYFCDVPGMVRRLSLDTGRDWQLQSFTQN